MTTRDAELTAVEHIKAASNFLRGSIREGLQDSATGALAEPDTQLSKFHGFYQQDDRDRRDERRPDKRTDKKADRQPDRARKRRGADRVATLEPEDVDTTAFDIELDPKRVASFGAMIEGQGKKKRRMPLSPEEDDYRPPPIDAPGGVAPPPPPPPASSDDDLFGDW